MEKFKKNDGYFIEKDGIQVSLVDDPYIVLCDKKKKRNKKIVGWSVFAAIFCVFAINILILPFTTSYARVAHISSYSGNNQYICFDDGLLLSAHRAGGDLAPEETLMAFDLCINATTYKVDVVEFDLHITKDNKLVLLHDDTVNRTSNASKVFNETETKVIDKTYAELRQLNMGENFKDTDGNYPFRGLVGADVPDNIKILWLDDLLDYLESETDGNLNYIIEIKDGGDDGERAMKILYNTLVVKGIEDRTIVGTFKDNVTKYIDKNYPDLNRSASILEVLDFLYAFLYNVDLSKRTLGYNVLQIPYDPFVLNLGSQALIDYAHKYDIAVQYWTINDPDKIKILMDNGADAIMTDNPEAAYKVINNIK